MQYSTGNYKTSKGGELPDGMPTCRRPAGRSAGGVEKFIEWVKN